MKNKENTTPEYERFSGLLREVLSVPRKEINEKLAEEKKAKPGKKKNDKRK